MLILPSLKELGAYPLTRQDRKEEGPCTNIESKQRVGLDIIDLIG